MRNEVDRGEVVARAAAAHDVAGRSGRLRARRQTVVARGDAHEAFGVFGRVAVENGLRHFLTHGFDERALFTETPLGRVAVDVREVLVHLGGGFEVAAGVRDLRSRGLRGLHAAVEFAPRRSRETRADRVQVAVRFVALNEVERVQDREFLVKNFRDRSEIAVTVETAHQVRKRRVLRRLNCHVMSSFSSCSSCCRDSRGCSFWDRHSALAQRRRRKFAH